jgi:hypothetical protein
MSEPDWEEYERRDRRSRRWRNPFTWTTLIALGWVAYELTAQPGLGAFIVCAKFGWNDFRTAFWLRRIDPNRARGRTCFWLYLASGLWKVAVTGSALMFVLGFCMAQQRGPRAGQPPQPFTVALEAALAGAGLSALIGFVLSTLATSRALWGAYWNGLRLWLSSGLHRARRAKVWPSIYPDCGSQNRIVILVYSTLILGWLVCFPLAFFLLDKMVGVVNGMGAGGASLVCMVLLIGGACGALLVRDGVLARMAAVSPGDCWGAVDWESLRWETGIDLDYSNAPSPAS